MKIIIFKYRTSVNGINNFFVRNSALSFVDKITFNRQLADSFPIFKEEYTSEEDINIFKTGYFDVKLSIIDSTRSVNGASTQQFFESFANTIQDYRFLVCCMTENALRNYSGFVDLNTLKENKNVIDDDYNITLSVTGIEAEFVDMMKTMQAVGILFDQKLDPVFLKTMIYWAAPERLQLQSRLFLTQHLGLDVTISKALYMQILNANLDPTESFTVFRSWDVFKSFLVGFGIRFKLVCAVVDSNFPAFNIYTFFRSRGISQNARPKFLTETNGYSFSGKDNIMMLYQERADEAQQEHITKYKGFIMTKDAVYSTTNGGDIIYNSNLKWFSYGLRNFEERSIARLNLDLHTGNFVFGLTSVNVRIAFCSCVLSTSPFPTPDNLADTLNPVLNFLANSELKYLLTAVKKQIKAMVKVNDSSGITAGAAVSLYLANNYDYLVERVNAYDSYNERMEIELLEK